MLRWNDTDSKLQLISRYGQLNAWNISAIRNLSGLFQDLEEFDEDIGAWDTSGVTDMSFMFAGAKSFNRPIGSWNVSRVTNMRGMFGNAAHFSQAIESWDVAAVSDMSDHRGPCGALRVGEHKRRHYVQYQLFEPKGMHESQTCCIFVGFVVLIACISVSR